MTNCPFCDNEIIAIRGKNLSKNCSCSNCGNFTLAPFMDKWIDGKIEEIFQANRDLEKIYHNLHLIAGFLYEFNRSKDEPYIFKDIADLEDILNDARMPKTSMQRLERFLLNLYNISNKFDELFSFNANFVELQTLTKQGTRELLRNYPISIAYARNVHEVKNMFAILEDLGYLKHKEKSSYFTFTPKGFERAEQLLSTNIESKSVFVAMAFREDLLEAHEKAIRPACEACGFDALIISDKHHNNGITDEIIVEIKKSKFVIVDFTYNNNGAYWEAGYAQGLGRTVIRCCKKEWFDSESKKLGKDNPLHFDVKHYNTILWENHDDFYDKLKNNIRANISDAKLDD